MEIRRHALVIAVAVAVVASFARVAAAATSYTVGAPDGLWDMQTDYAEWVAARTFHPGDNISKLYYTRL
jgi:hypothetical protein